VHPGDRGFELGQDLPLRGRPHVTPPAWWSVDGSIRPGPLSLVALTSHDVGVSEGARVVGSTVRSVTSGHDLNATGCRPTLASRMRKKMSLRGGIA
jgi:hypothetical protein